MADLKVKLGAETDTPSFDTASRALSGLTNDAEKFVAAWGKAGNIKAPSITGAGGSFSGMGGDSSTGGLAAMPSSVFAGPLGILGSGIIKVVGAAITEGFKIAVSTLEAGLRYDAKFQQLGRTYDTGKIRELRNFTLQISKELNKTTLPGFTEDEGAEIATLMSQQGKLRGIAPGGAGQKQFTEQAGILGRETGMGAARSAEILLEQSRSLNVPMDKFEDFKKTLAAVSRVSGISSEQLSTLSDRVVSLGMSFGKSGEQGLKFSQDAVVVGGRLAELGFNASTMMAKLTQQSTGSEAGVIQSLILGGPADQLGKRFESAKVKAQELLSLVSGVDPIFREMMIAQMSPVFGLGGMNPGEVTRLGQAGNEKEFRENEKALRVEHGTQTDNDYLAKIAEALQGTQDFYRSDADYVLSAKQAFNYIQTEQGLDFADKAADAIKKNRGQIDKWADEYGRLLNLIMKAAEATVKLAAAIYEWLTSGTMKKVGQIIGATGGDFSPLGIGIAAASVQAQYNYADSVDNKNVGKTGTIKNSEILNKYPTPDIKTTPSQTFAKLGEAYGIPSNTITTTGGSHIGDEHRLGLAADLPYRNISRMDKLELETKLKTAGAKVTDAYSNTAESSTGEVNPEWTGPHLHVLATASTNLSKVAQLINEKMQNKIEKNDPNQVIQVYDAAANAKLEEIHKRSLQTPIANISMPNPTFGTRPVDMIGSPFAIMDRGVSEPGYAK